MKRYGVFAYSNYYPYGGFNDLVFNFDYLHEVDDAKEKDIDLDAPSIEHIQLVNFRTGDFYEYEVDEEEYNVYRFTKEDLVTILATEFDCLT